MKSYIRYFRTKKYFILFIATVVVFFWPLFIQGKLPIPSDALVGLYHPWRDALKTEYPNGFPFKNPLITDPIRQQYPYRFLALEAVKNGSLPLWNPYSFSGTPLLANIQTALFYPLNILFFVLPFPIAWSLLVFLQPLLGGIFLYSFLRSFNLGERACFLGALSFSFCGFMVSWLEWNTVDQVIIWLPLLLLSIEHLFRRLTGKWMAIFTVAAIASFTAGHLQTFLYVTFFTVSYLVAKLWMNAKTATHHISTKKYVLIFLSISAVVLLITSVQWVPTLQFIVHSARNNDLPDWRRPDWFIPWQHLIQFIAPDFFGNPATGNYYGVWNYGEFVGYLALLPLLMATFALLARHDKKTRFFAFMMIISLTLALPNWISELPYRIQIPFLSTMQPSRNIVLIDFCLAVLAALGLDYIVKPEKDQNRRTLRVLSFSLLIILGLWAIVLTSAKLGLSQIVQSSVAQRNLLIPSGIFVFSAFGMLGLSRFGIKKILLTRAVILVLFIVTIFDLYRFFTKFLPFTDAALLFPKTATIEFLQSHARFNRILATDRRILPPNVSAYYQFADVSGYDPLYLQSYGELIAVMERDAADFTPAQFNRIITPQNIDSPILNLLAVKYIVGFDHLTQPNLKLVFSEGETKVYENTAALPRAYFAQTLQVISDKKLRVEALLKLKNTADRIAYLEAPLEIADAIQDPSAQVNVSEMSTQKIKIEVSTQTPRLLVISSPYDDFWNVYIDGVVVGKPIRVNEYFMGVQIPTGTHHVELRYRLF